MAIFILFYILNCYGMIFFASKIIKNTNVKIIASRLKKFYSDIIETYFKLAGFIEAKIFLVF